MRQAALDYVEAIYNVQPERIERSVHPTLNKRGFYKKDATSPYVESPMTYEQLVEARIELEQGRQARHQASGRSPSSTCWTRQRS